MLNRVRARAARMPRLYRSWLLGICVAIVLEIALHFGATHHVAWINAMENWALDSMMRMHAAIATHSAPTQPAIPGMTLIAVDDATWRSADWGGGEPGIAPRRHLADLVGKAFAAGARQVVLDVLIEAPRTRPAPPPDDTVFVQLLQQQMETPAFGPDRRLVLVRTLRQPLALPGDEPAAAGSRERHGAYLPEMRESPAIDALVQQSGGRIVLAAPYFQYSDDKILRDWQLFQVVCQRAEDGLGSVQVLPSVQVVVAAAAVGADEGLLPWKVKRMGQACRPFPPAVAEDSAAVARMRTEAAPPVQLQALVDAVDAGAWASMMAAFLHAGVPMPARPADQHNPANRVVFRHAEPPRLMSAMTVLAALPEDLARAQPLRDEVVVIGQTFAESGDHHATPLGRMSGSLVLLNAIDSMLRYRVVDQPAPWLKYGSVLLFIVVVAGLHARYGLLWGTGLGVSLVLLLMVLSFQLFRSGVWLDFAVPLAGVLAHGLFDLVREHKDHEDHDHAHHPQPLQESHDHHAAPTQPSGQTATQG